jgi:hypothetical protein
MEALVLFTIMALGGGLYVGTAEAVNIGILAGSVGQGGGLLVVVSSMLSLETSSLRVVILLWNCSSLSWASAQRP